MKNLPTKAAVLLVLGVLYGIAPSHAKPAMPLPLTAETKAPPVPKAVFVDAAGGKHSIGDFKGKYVLVNLWATWCAPCRKEMPALDKLQAELGGANFEVVSINIDQRGGEKPAKFLDDIGVTRLARYSDVSAKVFSDLKTAGKAFGMPTTILIDPNGCELANLAGPAEWASPDAFAVIRAALAK